ncbi:efflux RND transporter permease subunit [Cytobacillus dafuensis]|uniref:Efflux RND transporter permease subunit n=1 Tax=Cytobacillus dafuensis TaxID=1742359 RepID=A0A5B8Z2B3_CYTDA|nr:efflux RND transporter permease subunit [Cytobacillus dafuensis]QED47038.1 efflux RND transporter permease subunit [Cytobacillus dafuensis]
MKFLVKFSMKNTAAMIILLILLTGTAIMTTMSLQKEKMPNIKYPYVQINTFYPGSPENVLENVTKPIEETLSGLQGVETIVSTSDENISIVGLRLMPDQEPEEVKDRVNSLLLNTNLPPQAQRPVVLTQGLSSQPFYYLSMSMKEESNVEKLNSIKEEILPELKSVQGVENVFTLGNRERIVSIKLDLSKLSTNGIAPIMVANAIESSLVEGAVGRVDLDNNSQLVRFTTTLNDLNELKEIEIVNNSTQKLTIGDVSIVEEVLDTKYLSNFNGKSSIMFMLFKSADGNVVDIDKKLSNLLNSWKDEFQEVNFQITINDALDTNHSINVMVLEGICGAILAAFMILLFLRNFRLTFVVIVSIPLSILLGLIGMSLFGISLNLMTLGGLAIAVGRVVDDSIVVVENIYSQLLIKQERKESVILFGTQQVASAIVSSTLTTAAVFVPLAFVSGVVGDVFKPFAITVICALIASLIVSVTFIPMLVKIMVLRQIKFKDNVTSVKEKNVVRKYKSLLNTFLNHKKKVLLAAFVVFIGSLIITIPTLPMAFMPSSDSERIVFFDIDLPQETSMASNENNMKEIEKLLIDAKDANGEVIFTNIQTLVGFNYETNVNEVYPYKTLIITEVSEGNSVDDVMDRYSDQIEINLPEGSAVDQWVYSLNPAGQEAQFYYILSGDNMEKLQESATLIKEEMESYDELVQINDSLNHFKNEVLIEIKEKEAKANGLKASDIVSKLQPYLNTSTLGSQIKLNDEEYQIQVKVNEDDINSIDKLNDLQISTSSNNVISLSEVATLKIVEAPVQIYRENSTQVVTINAKINGEDEAGISNRLYNELAKVELPEGVERNLGGVSDSINESFKQMFIAMFVSVLAVYFVLVITFRNASAPFAILFSLPLALIGGLYGLMLTGNSINVTTLIGFLMLIGIVVTNAIVLIDRVEQYRAQNMNVREAIIEASVTRIKPILMTAGATMIALIPLAIGLSESTVMSQGLAVVVIGGLLTSTLLTLIIVPVVYELINSIRQARFSKRNKKLKVDDNKVSV